MKVDIKDKRILLYYILNIFLVLNMMIIMFSAITMLGTGEVKSVNVYKFVFNTIFYTLITKGIIGVLMRLNKKNQIILLVMSLIMALIVLIMSVLINIFIPKIVLQFTLLLIGIYTILYNYIVLKGIRQYIPLVVLTSVYSFFTFALFIILFTDIYKLFFEYTPNLSGVLSILIVYVSLEMLQLLSYVPIPEYYSKNIEVTDIFDEFFERYDIRIRNEEEKEKTRNQRLVERRMLERQKQAEKEKLREEKLKNRKKIKSEINPFDKKRLAKHLKNNAKDN